MSEAEYIVGAVHMMSTERVLSAQGLRVRMSDTYTLGLGEKGSILEFA